MNDWRVPVHGNIVKSWAEQSSVGADVMIKHFDKIKAKTVEQE
jgi:hypothetical protein